ncbi:MAG: glycoside hydrolase family 2 protein, partial [Erysipelotrichaceae bacterium]|nr:glycoside hydrolase family 2 protein [Erysipelotrichaceae bacterium]
GYAMPESMQRMDAHILHDELKLNAVRTSHYPQSHHFLDECDRLGLLVFTELPGWQHIGDEEWKLQAIKNVEEMVIQYRNHPSIILWGVRINESADDDEFYTRTNEVAHRLDKTRCTSGVRYSKKSSLLEDVYAFNDFSHEGHTKGCLAKKAVTPDMNKGYLISEYNGHMYPTKAYDDEIHRTEHFLRHTRVLDEVRNQEDIAGSFGWCMADYNTHKDFGSGDRICHHGVMDMYRNPKLAAYAYKTFGEEAVLEVASSMNIGEYPGGNLSELYVASNADKLRLYKNDELIREFDEKDRPFKHLENSPFFIDDFIGERLEINEGFSGAKAKDVKKVLIGAQKYGMDHLPLDVKLAAGKCLTLHKMTFDDAVNLYGKYIGGWGDDTTVWKFEAIKHNEVVKTCIKSASFEVKYEVQVSSTVLVEGDTYDVASIRLRAMDEHNHLLAYYQEPVSFEASGAIELIGPKVSSFRGGSTGTYVKSVKPGKGVLTLHFERGEAK